jgi:apolipoprotein N-acyltransferase
MQNSGPNTRPQLNKLPKKNNRHQLGRAIQFILLLIAHFILLSWMLYTLKEAGHWSALLVFKHFCGMAIYGALLIWLCARIYRKRYLRGE